MRIERTDTATASDDLLAALYDLHRVISLEFDPDDQPSTVEEYVAVVRNRPPEIVSSTWYLRDGTGTVLATGQLSFADVEENRHLADAHVNVRPDARRQGLGRSLLTPIAVEAKERERSVLHFWTPEGAVGEQFLTRLGAEKRYVEHENRLRTAALDRGMLEDWVADAAKGADGYSLLCWDGPTPAEHLAAFARLLDVMNDAPRGELSLEDERNRPEIVAGWETAMQRRGQSIWTVIARHDATGALAGWTSLLFPKVRTDVAYQLGTGVEPAHRGHGLGRWVKAVNLLRLLDERPAVQRVETENATNNGPMLAINHALGFSSYRTNGVWEMKTAALAS